MPHKRTKAEKSASAKKGARTRKRNQGLSAPVKRRSKTTVRTRGRKKGTRKRKGLGEIITNLEAKTGFNNIMNGAAGGLVAYGLDDILPAAMPSRMRLLWTAAIGFGVATIGKAPYVGAGITGVAAYKALIEMGLLNEKPYADPIEQLPMILDAEGNPMMLEQSPETGGMYLDEEGYYMTENGELYLDENGNYLQDEAYSDTYQVPYATDFSGSWGY